MDNPRTGMRTNWPLVIASLSLMIPGSGCLSTSPTQPTLPDTALSGTWAQPNQMEPRQIHARSLDFFGDPELITHLKSALAAPSLDVFVSRIQRARAQQSVATADWRPVFSLDAAASGGVEAVAGDISGHSLFSFLPLLNWELDLWGRGAAAEAAAEARSRATEADLAGARLSLLTETASSWFRLRGLQEEIAILNESTQIAEKILDLYTREKKVGRADAAKLLRQQAEVTRLRAVHTDLIRQREVERTRLTYLTAMPRIQPPKEGLAAVSFSQLATEALQMNLLEQRPDLRAAGARYRAAVFRRDVSNIALLPSIRLLTREGMMQPTISDAIENWSFGLGPALSIPILTPRMRAQVEVDAARLAEADAVYRDMALQALQEVESAVANRQHLTRQLEHLNRTTEALGDVRAFHLKKLKQGLISQVELLDVERDLLDARRLEVDVRLRQLLAELQFFKAVGGAL